jgi:hypothetical protein
MYTFLRHVTIACLCDGQPKGDRCPFSLNRIKRKGRANGPGTHLHIPYTIPRHHSIAGKPLSIIGEGEYEQSIYYVCRQQSLLAR